jgi:CheY-like chemotaxis protein
MVALTGEWTSTILHEVAAAGFDAYIAKPFTMKKLKGLKFGLTKDIAVSVNSPQPGNSLDMTGMPSIRHVHSEELSGANSPIDPDASIHTVGSVEVEMCVSLSLSIGSNEAMRSSADIGDVTTHTGTDEGSGVVDSIKENTQEIKAAPTRPPDAHTVTDSAHVPIGQDIHIHD